MTEHSEHTEHSRHSEHGRHGVHADHIARLDVTVPTAPVPGLIRPGIEAALAGRPGPEPALGQAIANAVAHAKSPAQKGDPAC